MEMWPFGYYIVHFSFSVNRFANFHFHFFTCLIYLSGRNVTRKEKYDKIRGVPFQEPGADCGGPSNTVRLQHCACC